MRYRFPILLAISMSYLGLSVPEIGLDYQYGFNKIPRIETLTAQAQDAPSDLANLTYDDYMREGYDATLKKDYKKAIKAFKSALQQRPEDAYAKRALLNVESYQKRGKTASGSNNISYFNSNSIPLIIGLVCLSLAIVGGGVFLASTLTRGTKPNKPKKSGKNKEGEENAEKNGFYGQVRSESFNNSSDYSNDTGEESETGGDSLPVQATARIPSLDLIEELMKTLRDPDAKNRRKAIWKLAQVSDSRAMKPLVDLMIETDSYERSLILEALSQVCSRTLRPMNQALAISLQDKNSQVRKNAIRDLTRLYDLMSQISELLCYALEDESIEVKETAKWALDKLNLRMPVKLNLGKMNEDDDSTFEEDDVEDEEEELEDTESFKR